MTPRVAASPDLQKIMVHSGADENPWIIVSEMTVNGCQGSETSASSGGNGSCKRPDKHPANDGSPPTDDPNATSGTNCRPLMREYKHNSHTPRDNRNVSKTSDLEELGNTGLYKLHQGPPPPRRLSFAMSSGCQQGSVPGELIPRQDVPRSMANNFDPLALTAYSCSMSNYQSSADVQEQNLPPGYDDKRSVQQKPRPNHQGRMDAKDTTNSQGPNRKGKTPTKQYAQGVQNITRAGYRQLDTNQTTEKDAETDEDVSQKPDMDENDCRQY